MDHENLDVYNASFDFVSFTRDAIKRMPGGRRGLDDELMRAATSMPLNIAEGAGEFSAKDKARFYRMARRSATESAAALDVSVRLGLAHESEVQPGRDLLRRIVAMLTKMVLGLQRTQQASLHTPAIKPSRPVDACPRPGNQPQPKARVAPARPRARDPTAKAWGESWHADRKSARPGPKPA